MPGMNMLPGGTTLQIPLDAPAGFTAEAGNAQVTLTWTDPKDKYATPEGETAQDPDQLVSVWEYTQIIRKTGSQPAGPHDGELVVSSSVRDQYATTGFVDTGLVNDTLYYYAAFAYNTDGVASEGAFASAKPIAGTPLSQLAEGTLIKILENGSPVEFYLAKHSYEPDLNGAGRELLVRKDFYSERQWNSSTINRWAECSLRSWLNSEYKSLFSSRTQEMMATFKYYYTIGRTSVGERSDSVIILSGTELGAAHEIYINDEGSLLPIAQTLRIGNQWTRSPRSSNDEDVYYIQSNAYVNDMSPTLEIPILPAFTLPSTALVDQDLNLIES